MKKEESAKLKEAGRDRMIWSDEMGSEKYSGERNRSGGKEKREQDRF